MTGQQLKNSILQMAVQGKLVPQNEKDEPASMLLERIRAEKDALIKSGKIRNDKRYTQSQLNEYLKFLKYQKKITKQAIL